MRDIFAPMVSPWRAARAVGSSDGQCQPVTTRRFIPCGSASNSLPRCRGKAKGALSPAWFRRGFSSDGLGPSLFAFRLRRGVLPRFLAPAASRKMRASGAFEDLFYYINLLKFLWASVLAGQ